MKYLNSVNYESLDNIVLVLYISLKVNCYLRNCNRTGLGRVGQSNHLSKQGEAGHDKKRKLSTQSRSMYRTKQGVNQLT